MSIDVDELKAMLSSIGCETKLTGTEVKRMKINRHLYVLMPNNFPWYGGGNKHESENSRIIACITLSRGEWKWADAWPVPDIHTSDWDDEPLGIEMRKGNIGVRTNALNALNEFNYEQIISWFQNKIGEVSKMTKEFRKLELEYYSKDYEV